MNTFRINKGMLRQWYAKVMVCKGNGMQRSSFASCPQDYDLSPSS